MENAVQTKIFSWLGGEFSELSGEARPATSIEEETVSLFQSFEQELKAHGLSLENTVRTRLWGRDREARNLGTATRSKILTGSAKAASSSYVSTKRFDSDARIAVDLLAMRPSRADAERRPVEFHRREIISAICVKIPTCFYPATPRLRGHWRLKCPRSSKP
jgi:enamine deaminase RidA (YjgF/YER057c/UK114 family)